MKVQCYAIYDTCSGIYEKPFFSTADDVVRREFQDVVNTDEHPMNRHPEHYSLWRLGTFDNLNGKIVDEDNECLWQGVEAISQPVRDPSALMDIKSNGANDEKSTPILPNA